MYVRLSLVFVSSIRQHTRFQGDWSSDVCSSDLRAIETPGHTPESISWLVTGDEKQRVLTGDTLFIGDVGRPDLAGRSEERRGGKDGRAGWLHDHVLCNHADRRDVIRHGTADD